MHGHDRPLTKGVPFAPAIRLLPATQRNPGVRDGRREIMLTPPQEAMKTYSA